MCSGVSDSRKSYEPATAVRVIDQAEGSAAAATVLVGSRPSEVVRDRRRHDGSLFRRAATGDVPWDTWQ